MRVFELPNKLTVDWKKEVRAIIDTWTTYNISLDEMRRAVLIEGVNFAKERQVKAWIVDSSSAKSAFSQDIHRLIDTEIFPVFHSIGVKYFITINSKISSITRLNVKQYSAVAGPNGVQLIELNSVADAVKWLKSRN